MHTWDIIHEPFSEKIFELFLPAGSIFWKQIISLFERMTYINIHSKLSFLIDRNCKLWVIKNQIYPHVLILGTSYLFIFAERDDHFRMHIIQSMIFKFDSNGMDCLMMDLNNLLSSLESTYRHCQTMRIHSEEKL